MRSRTRVGWSLVLGLAAAAGWAEPAGALRWRAGAAPLGLHAPQWSVPCGGLALPCGTETILPLYASEDAPRTLSMQLREADGLPRMPRGPGLNVSLVGQAGIAPALGVWGRIGAATPPPVPGWAAEPGLTYGVGLRWEFSRRGSASLGWDSYDLRTAGGASRDVRATSLGLQWRY